MLYSCIRWLQTLALFLVNKKGFVAIQEREMFRHVNPGINPSSNLDAGKLSNPFLQE